MPLINCEINLDLNWSEKTAVTNQRATFSITDTKLYVPVVTLSTQVNTEILKQLKSGFKRTIKCNKYKLKKINRKAKPIFRLLNCSKLSRRK